MYERYPQSRILQIEYQYTIDTRIGRLDSVKMKIGQPHTFIILSTKGTPQNTTQITLYWGQSEVKPYLLKLIMGIQINWPDTQTKFLDKLPSPFPIYTGGTVSEYIIDTIISSFYKTLSDICSSVLPLIYFQDNNERQMMSEFIGLDTCPFFTSVITVYKL